MAKTKILVIEDEEDIREIIEYNLFREGYEVFTAEDGETGVKLAKEKVPHLVILDIMLPGIDGLEVCRQLRETAESKTIPVIMLTAKSEETDVVIGLGVGADDYVIKPFGPKELVARIKAVLRRSNQKDKAVKTDGMLTFGNLVVNLNSFEASSSGEVIALTATEFRLLSHMAQNPGRVFTREQLMERVLGEHTIVIDRNIDVHILSIRKKLGDEQKRIETVRGVGYRFNGKDNL